MIATQNYLLADGEREQLIAVARRVGLTQLAGDFAHQSAVIDLPPEIGARIERLMPADGTRITAVYRYPAGVGLHIHIDQSLRLASSTLLRRPEAGGQLRLHTGAGPVTLASEPGMIAVYDPKHPHGRTPVLAGECWALICAVLETARWAHAERPPAES